MLRKILSSLCGVAAGVAITTPANAEILYLGLASTGQQLRLNIDSIKSQGSGSPGGFFDYYLHNERIPAVANCARNTWFVDGQEYSPQSQATRNMISIVCSAKDLPSRPDQTPVLVHEPPSNVRKTPAGEVLCLLDTMKIINVHNRNVDGWHLNTACIQDGYIHHSQFRRIR